MFLAVRLAAEIVDRPRNEMTCDDIVKRANEIAATLPGVETLVFRGEELRVRGFGGK